MRRQYAIEVTIYGIGFIHTRPRVPLSPPREVEARQEQEPCQARFRQVHQDHSASYQRVTNTDMLRCRRLPLKFRRPPDVVR
jgi:hypothetical protein